MNSSVACGFSQAVVCYFISFILSDRFKILELGNHWILDLFDKIISCNTFIDKRIMIGLNGSALKPNIVIE